MRKNYIFLIPAMRGGGAERVISILSRYFSEQGDNVTIAVFKEDVREYDIAPTVKYDTSLVGKCGNPIKRLYYFHKYMKHQGDSYVFSFFTSIGLYILAASFFTKAKVVISERLDPAQSIPQKRWLFKLRELLYKHASGFVFQTQDALHYFDEKIQARSIVIPNPLKDTLPERYEGVREKRIVTFARLEPQKNYPLLIDAFDEFSKEHKDYILEIYGQGSMEESLRDLVQKRDLSDKIIFKGFVPNLHKQIRNARMFVLPSDYEGLSNSMLEAMAIGLPCVCTDCPPGGAKMFIENGVNGLLVPIRNKSAMVEAMKRVADNEELADTLSKNAYSVRTELTIEKICTCWERYLETLS